MILVDTNLAARVIQPAHRHHQAAVNALAQLAGAGEDFGISVHNLYEFYFIMTKPVASNGFGYSPQQAGVELENAQGLYQLLPEATSAYYTWKGLVGKYAIGNRACFDAKIVASMVENRIPAILTFNDADFNFYDEITAINPFDVLGVARDP